MGKVAPRTGAWIETISALLTARMTPSRPSYRGVDRNGCVLKLPFGSLRRPSYRGVDRNGTTAPTTMPCGVAPRTGAWIETPIRQGDLAHSAVAPRTGAWIETFPYAEAEKSRVVAPRTGAWIETVAVGDTLYTKGSRPSYRGVDRNSFAPLHGQRPIRRPSYRGVDRNPGMYVYTDSPYGRPSYRGVDRNLTVPRDLPRIRGRPSYRGVDRNRHN